MEAALIEHEALLLPEAQRALLADRLLQSLGTEDEAVTAAWAAEADRRFAAWQQGEIKDVDGPEAVERIRRSLP